MDKEAIETTGVSCIMTGLVAYLPEIEGFLIFGFTLVYLYWKIRCKRAEAKRIEKELNND